MTTTKRKSKPKAKPGTSKAQAQHRRTLFVEAFIANGGNATQAAITAGYSERTAYSQGPRLLEDVEIQQMIASRQDVLAEKHALTTDSVLAELSKIVHADPRKLFKPDGSLLHPSEWPDDIAGAVASMEVVEEFSGKGEDRELIGYTKKIKFNDKNSGIDKAMKHLGLFERDNKQKAAGFLADLPRDVLKMIAQKLEAARGKPGP